MVSQGRLVFGGTVGRVLLAAVWTRSLSACQSFCVASEGVVVDGENRGGGGATVKGERGKVEECQVGEPVPPVCGHRVKRRDAVVALWVFRLER